MTILAHLVKLCRLTKGAVLYSLVMADEIPTEPGIGDAKAHLSEYVNRVLYRGEVVWVTKNKRRVAALIPADVAEWIEANAAAVAASIALARDGRG